MRHGVNAEYAAEAISSTIFRIRTLPELKAVVVVEDDVLLSWLSKANLYAGGVHLRLLPY